MSFRDYPTKGTIIVGSGGGGATPVAVGGDGDALLADSGEPGGVVWTPLAGADGDAIHGNVAGEIKLVALKGTPVNADMLLIEDSVDSDNKKRITIGSLPGGGGGETNTASNQGTDGVGVYYQKSGVDLQFRHVAPGSAKVTITLNGQDIDVDVDLTQLWRFIASAVGGLTDYDLEIGDPADYGILRIGNAIIGRTSYNVGSLDLDGAIILRNVGAPATSNIEFAFAESSNAIRFAIPKSGVGNATYNPRSMLCAGPAVLDDTIVTVGYWQSQGIFHNLACDTATDGADLGVQNDLEVEGDIFVDNIEESTPAAGVTIDGVLVKDSSIGPAYTDMMPYCVEDTTGGTAMPAGTASVQVILDSETISNANYSLASNVITVSDAGIYQIGFHVRITTPANVSSTRGGWESWVEVEPSGGGGYTRINQLSDAAYWREQADDNCTGTTAPYSAAAGDKFRIMMAHTNASTTAWLTVANRSQINFVKLS